MKNKHKKMEAQAWQPVFFDFLLGTSEPAKLQNARSLERQLMRTHELCQLDHCV